MPLSKTKFDSLLLAFKPADLIQLLYCMLFEYRIIFHSASLELVSEGTQAAVALLYPLAWAVCPFTLFFHYYVLIMDKQKYFIFYFLLYKKYVYIPVLPENLLDYCSAPMPFILGITSNNLEEVKSKPLEEVVFANIDTGTLTSNKPPSESTFPNTENVLPSKYMLAISKSIQNARKNASRIVFIQNNYLSI